MTEIEIILNNDVELSRSKLAVAICPIPSIECGWVGTAQTPTASLKFSAVVLARLPNLLGRQVPSWGGGRREQPEASGSSREFGCARLARACPETRGSQAVWRESCQPLANPTARKRVEIS